MGELVAGAARIGVLTNQLTINAIIYAELSVSFGRIEDFKGASHGRNHSYTTGKEVSIDPLLHFAQTPGPSASRWRRATACSNLRVVSLPYP